MEAEKPKRRKGRPLILLRVDPALLAWIDEQVEKSQSNSVNEPYDRSSFVRACIYERKDKYRRAKEAQQRKKKGKAALQEQTEKPAELSN